MIKQLRYFFTLLLLAVASVGWADSYVKVTSTTDITDGAYLIVYEGADGAVAFNGALETLDAVGNTISVTIADGIIEATSETDAAAFTIDVTNGTLKSASGLYIGIASYGNGLKQSEDATAFVNGFAIDDNGNALITCETSGGTMTLKYNYASNQLRFRYYKSGQQDIQLYKKTEGTPTPAAPNVATLNSISPTTLTVGDEGTFTLDATFASGAVAETDYVINWSTEDAAITLNGAQYSAVSAGNANVKVTVTSKDEKKFKSVSKTFPVTIEAAVTPGEYETVTLPYEESLVNDKGKFVTEGDECWTFGNYGAVASKKNVTAWLVSPIIDMTGAQAVSLSFEQQGRYFNTPSEEATLWARVEGGEWTQLTITYPESFTGTKWTSFSEQVVDLSTYAGKKAQIGFKYISTDSYGGWEIKNINVVAGEIKEKAEAELSYPVENFTAIIGEENDFPVLQNPNKLSPIEYSSTNAEVATIDENGVITLLKAGQTTIKASFTENDDFKDGSASYLLVVKEKEVEGTDKYELVTDASTLVAGDNIIIAYVNSEENVAKALSTTRNANNIAANDVKVNADDNTLTPGSSIQIITLEEGYYFNVGDGYLFAASASSNWLRVEAEKDDNAKATISIADNGDATIVFQGENTRNNLRYNANNGNPMFSCYAETSSVKTLPQIYRKVTGETPPTPPVPEKKEAGLSYSAETAVVTINANDNVYPILNNPNELSPITFTSSNTGVATIDTDGKVELVAAGETTIKASFAGNDEYESGEASYVLTVNEAVVVEKKPAEISYPVSEFNAYIGDEVDFPALQNPNNLSPIIYASGKEEIATIDADGNVTLVAAGRVRISAKFEGNDEYEDAEVSYMLNVMEHPQKGTEIFDLVTDASTLSAGDEFVIAAPYTNSETGVTKYFALGVTQNNNNRAAVEIELEADGTIMPHTTTQRITLEGEPDAWNLAVVGVGEGSPSGYLYASSKSSNQLKTRASVGEDGAADATITIASDGTASIVFHREEGRNDLRFNSTSTIFSCYAEGNNQTPVQIFRKRLDYLPVTITDAGYATLYYSDKNLQVPEGVKAYTVKVENKAAVVSKEYNVIPAGSAVILQGAPGDYEFAIKIKGDALDEANMLMGTDEAAMTVGPDEGDYKFYKLADGKSYGLGFYYDAEDGAAFMNGAHKAYLAVEASKAVNAYGFNPTGIKTVMANLPENAEVYTISGVRVNNTNLPAGLYIVNGKKMVIK